MIVLPLDIICEETNAIVYGFSIGIIHSFSENSDKCKSGGRKKNEMTQIILKYIQMWLPAKVYPNPVE